MFLYHAAVSREYRPFWSLELPATNAAGLTEGGPLSYGKGMTPSRWPRRLRAIHRVAAFAISLLWCAGPLLADLHAAAEVHRFCVEHGVIEEAGGGAAVAGRGEAGGGPAARGEAESGPGHDECAFSELWRSGQTPALQRFELVTREPAKERPALVPPNPGERPVALIRLAPKTSPPA